ncbi:glucose transporter 4 enhancer factor isoform X3 [Rhynchophorus ferrugineus]|uniref:glucose transporter 4 enhancer factor isoform X3 n=1 Tax=Rhynchophorus ferrugineus TaxID=354439 RepID=UPI003FCE6757
MSTGKRIAKRSIIGTRVCAPVQDGKYYSGVIQAVKTPAHIEPQSNCLNLTPDTRYTVRFDSRQGNVGGTTVEYFEADLIGPGFHSVVGTELVRNQKCFVTFNGREVCGEVMTHHVETDEVIIRIHPSGTEAPFEVQKKLEEVRLLESRKSARLADQDTDFARLADMAGDRKRTASHTIEVPASSHHGSRKRRTSSSQDDNMHPKDMDECSAALVLMSLSCSPQNAFSYGTSPGSSNSSSASFRSTPSPPPFNSPMNSFSSVSDEGIVMDYIGEDQPRKKKVWVYPFTFEKEIWGSYSFNIEGYDSALAKEKEIQGQIYHLLGALLLLPDADHQFLQIYFMGNSDAEVDKRWAHNPAVKGTIVQELQIFLLQDNNLVNMFKIALDQMPSDSHNIVIRRFNSPTIDEVAVVIVGENLQSRDIVLHRRSNDLIYAPQNKTKNIVYRKAFN